MACTARRVNPPPTQLGERGGLAAMSGEHALSKLFLKVSQNTYFARLPVSESASVSRGLCQQRQAGVSVKQTGGSPTHLSIRLHSGLEIARLLQRRTCHVSVLTIGRRRPSRPGHVALIRGDCAVRTSRLQQVIKGRSEQGPHVHWFHSIANARNRMAASFPGSLAGSQGPRRRGWSRGRPGANRCNTSARGAEGVL